MAVIVVERTFSDPVPFERLAAMERAVSWCLEQYDVKARESFRARDGKYMVCIYEAPDAEAVRAVHRQSGLPYDEIWAAERLIPPGRADDFTGPPPGFQQVVVQRVFPMAVNLEICLEMFERTRGCLDIYRTDHVSTYLATAGTRAVCHYVAPDTESVRLVSMQGGVPVERAWPAEHYT